MEHRVEPVGPGDGAAARPRGRGEWLWGAVILAVTAAVYLPAIRSGYIWDDDDYLTKNALVQSPGGLRRIWLEPTASPQYYPVVFTTFWIEHKAWGLNPAGYHLVNVLLHACNAVLVWRMLRWLRMPGALFAGLVFALHPVQVESVAWVTERKNVLSGLFYLGGLWAYLRYSLPEWAGEEKRSTEWYGLAAVLFVCALLSKSVTATMPAVALVIIWWKRGSIRRQDAAAALPLFVVGLVAALHTASLEKHHVGAEEVAWGLSGVDRCLLAGRVIWFYLLKLAWPGELIFFYPKWKVDAGAAWQYVFPIGVISLLAAAFALRHRVGRGPAAALFCFCGTLVPVLGFVKVYPMIFSYVADHFQYLASIGGIALGAGILARVPVGNDASRRGVFSATGAVVLCVLGWMTWQRCGVFKDEETLWRDTIARNDAAWAAYNNLGMLVREKGRGDEAFDLLSRAIAARPDYEVALDNLGLMMLQRGRSDEAFDLFRRATEANRYYASAQRNYGRMLCDRGQMEEGVRHILASIEIRPNQFESYEDLGNAYFRLGRNAEAIQNYRKVLALNPDYALGMNNLAAALAADGKTDEAIELIGKALGKDPKLAVGYYTMGTVLAGLGRTDAAMASFRRALELQPHYPLAHTNLAALLAGVGRMDEAMEHFRAAVRQAPDDADAHFNLARALEGRGLREEAAREYREVLRINPNEAEARKAVGGG